MENNNSSNEKENAPSENSDENVVELKASEPAREELDPIAAAQREILYVRAEFDNFRKRILREQQDTIRMANKNLLSDLFPVLDLFDRAVAASTQLKAKEEAELKNYLSGIEMTRQELVQLLTRNGVEFIGAVGEKFDPNRHEAVSEQEAPPEKAGTVLSVFERGALLHGKLLKPARVVVARKS